MEFVPSLQGSSFSAPWSTTRIPAPARGSDAQPVHDAHAAGVELHGDADGGFYGVQILEIRASRLRPLRGTRVSGVNPVYTAFVAVYVAPRTPQIASISVGGQTVSGSTFANNRPPPRSSPSISRARSPGPRFPSTSTAALRPSPRERSPGRADITLTTNGTTRSPTATTCSPSTVDCDPQLTLYTDWTSTGRAHVFRSRPIPSAARPRRPRADDRPGILVPPITTAQVNVPYTYVLQTNAPAADVVTVTQATLPPGMQLTGNTFTWTPTMPRYQSFPFSVQIADSAGRTGSLATVDISVILGLAPSRCP